MGKQKCGFWFSGVAFIGLAPLGIVSTQPGALAAQCPVVPDTFLNGECTESVLTAPTDFYRYYNQDDSLKFGRFLTTDRYFNNVDVITLLALSEDFGNRAERVETVTLPANTVVYQGVVGPQPPAACYPGGGQQTFITDSRDPGIIWNFLADLTIKPFSCSPTSVPEPSAVAGLPLLVFGAGLLLKKKVKLGQISSKAVHS